MKGEAGRWRVLAIGALVAWGALAFGAVYPWAFVPLFAGAALLGILLCAAPGGRTSRLERRAAAALAAIVIVPILQLVPLPAGVLAAVTPETDVFLRAFRIDYPVPRSWHPLSIWPSSTVVGLGAALSLSLLLVGVSWRMTAEEARRIVRIIAWVGLVMSVAGLVQQAMWNGRIYGVWRPLFASMPFGPFVNRNHFAGWVLMAVPLVAAYAGARLASGLRASRDGRVDRARWLASSDGTRALLAAFAAGVMVVAIVMSLSRSGVVCLAAAVMMTLVVLARRRRAARVAAAVAIVLVVVAAVASSGVDRLAARFGSDDVATFGNRAGVWSDTWGIARRFPFAGTGLNTFGTATLVYQTSQTDKHYREAHNDYLQILAEGGALLAVPVALAILAFAVIVRRRFREVEAGSTDYWLRVGAVTGLAGIALQSMADFSLQMPGNALLFVIVLAIAARRASAVNSLS